jgi:hypothetical protein
MTKVINLIAGPGAGKSTTAAGLFFRMKLAGIKCELVTEFAKELTYDENWADLKRQIYVMAEQERRQRRLLGKVDYIITDAPLLTGIEYISDPIDRVAVEKATVELFEQYDNINITVVRSKPYAEYGRSQTEAEARDLDHRLAYRYIKYPMHFTVPGDEDAPIKIIERLMTLGFLG